MEQTTTQIRSQTPVIAPPIKYCIYARKSMEAEDQQGYILPYCKYKKTALPVEAYLRNNFLPIFFINDVNVVNVLEEGVETRF